ncbi:mucin-12 isoform X2 [Zootermopsis nevadensis]|nr:mucin-12 isoform X2 [Zootermopsis nevadensis]
MDLLTTDTVAEITGSGSGTEGDRKQRESRRLTTIIDQLKSSRTRGHGQPQLGSESSASEVTYSETFWGEGQGDSETVPVVTDLHHQQVPASAASAAVASAKPRGKRRGATVSRDNGATATMNGASNTTEHHHHHNNNNNNPSVKTERLSPSTTTSATAPTATTIVTGGGPGNATSNTPDNNSSSSRSATPSSSYPGTPPGALTAERAASPSSSSAGQFKHMEQMMSRNYSDFMRSLAAKYNNANPNDYFSSPTRNGFPVGLDPRFTPFKTGATSFVSLMTPLGTATMPSPGHQKNNSTTANSNSASTTSGNSIGGTSASSKECIIDMNHLKKPVSSSVEAQQALYAAAAANFGANPFSTAASSNTPIFPPLIDMSSTQALLSMVRTASAHNASQLENYLKGANKRPSPSESSPLDLSSGSIPTYKRSRTNKGAGGASETIFLNSDSLLHVPMVDALRTTKERLGKRTGSVSPKPPVRNNGGSSAGSSPRLLPSSTVTSASATASQQHVLGRNLPCLSMCSADRACSSGGDPQAMAQWSVEDVCSFVASIDICAEYAPNFREQRIDGSSLPLLTEDHLTVTMGMKLGPALKLRATLSRRLGHCAICLHCVHCHNTPTSLAAIVSPARTPPSVLSSAIGRPNSTGN